MLNPFGHGFARVIQQDRDGGWQPRGAESIGCHGRVRVGVQVALAPSPRSTPLARSTQPRSRRGVRRARPGPLAVTLLGMAYAVVFPGQGSQFVGMADGWASDPAGKAVLDEASEAMGRDVVAGCHDEDALATTEFVQPALLACDVAAFEAMRARRRGRSRRGGGALARRVRGPGRRRRDVVPRRARARRDPRAWRCSVRAKTSRAG